MRRLNLGLYALLVSLSVYMIVFVSIAGAAETSNAPALPNDQLLTSTQFYAFLVGAVLQIVTYVINHYAPWTSDTVKSFITVLFAAVAGAVVQLVNDGSLAFDTNTLQVVLTAVAGALSAHAGLWTRNGVAAKLGGGANKPGQPA